MYKGWNLFSEKGPEAALTQHKPQVKTEIALQFSASCAATEVAPQDSACCNADVIFTESCTATNGQLHCNIEKAALEESVIYRGYQRFVPTSS